MTTLDTPDILKQIVAEKRVEVERLKQNVPVSELGRRIEEQTWPHRLGAALTGGGVSVIAEIKKASPSKGLLRADFDPPAHAKSYVENGAAAVSVLTNTRFQGEIEHLRQVHAVTHPAGKPVLRKEFTFDPYQVVEARAYGADAILLIVAMLSREQIQELMGLSSEHGMDCLVEVHDERELDVALNAGADVIGINNRDLRTFHTDLETTDRLAPLVPDGRTVVSESGIASRADITRVQNAGAHAVLVGESLMVSPDPGAMLGALV